MNEQQAVPKERKIMVRDMSGLSLMSLQIDKEDDEEVATKVAKINKSPQDLFEMYFKERETNFEKRSDHFSALYDLAK
jgi:hypothetical protein